MSNKKRSAQGHHIAMLRNRARAWDSPPRRELKRRASEEENLVDVLDRNFWNQTIYSDDIPFDQLDGPTDEELSAIEAEEYQPPPVIRSLDDLPVVADRDEDYRQDDNRYDDY